MNPEENINGSITDKICYQDDSLSIRRESYEKARSNMPLHLHDYLTISILISGNLVEYNEQDFAGATTGSIFIKPPGSIHGDLFTDKTSIISIRVYDYKYYGLDFDRWDVIAPGIGFPYFFRLINTRNKKAFFDEFKGFLTKGVERRQQKQHAPEWLQEVKSILLSSFQESPKISHLAMEARKHPVHLARSFKKFYGLDIKTYQTLLKARHALEEMSHGQKNLTQIAYESGFADQSHFSREFKKLTHFSPRQARSMFSS